MKDVELRETIEERLHFDPTVNDDDIEVMVQDGTVTLLGEVDSRDDRKWIDALVRQVGDVKEVINHITFH